MPLKVTFPELNYLRHGLLARRLHPQDMPLLRRSIDNLTYKIPPFIFMEGINSSANNVSVYIHYTPSIISVNANDILWTYQYALIKFFKNAQYKLYMTHLFITFHLLCKRRKT